MNRWIALGTCLLVAALWVDVPSASSIPPRWRVPGTGSHAYPPAFESFMAATYGDLWMHTVQEQVIRRTYRDWQLKQVKK